VRGNPVELYAMRRAGDLTPLELYGILTGERRDVEEILAAIQRWLTAHPETRDDDL
jgi:hypothetical protein